MIIQRFVNKIDHDANTFCWNWTACKDKDGYGVFGFRGKNVRAHRFAYEYWNKQIPQGLQIDHLCRNRKCVNPTHLETVTLGENVRRSPSFNRQKTHCPYGHEYTSENTRIHHGTRECRTCENKRSRNYHKTKVGLKLRNPKHPLCNKCGKFLTKDNFCRSCKS